MTGYPLRTWIARRLDDFGVRMQYSIFRTVLDRPLFDNMVAEFNGLVDPRPDRAIGCPICAASCRKAVVLVRSATETRPGREIAFIV